METDEGRIKMDKSIELLFNDSSKKFAELKARQWNTANLSVAAIMALAALAQRDTLKFTKPMAVTFMALVLAGSLVVVSKCDSNLDVFRVRLKSLVRDHFAESSQTLFKDDPAFETIVEDEGRITFMLWISTSVAFVCGCLWIYFSQ